jgi:putative GTP pyrophosphokinase
MSSISDNVYLKRKYDEIIPIYRELKNSFEDDFRKIFEDQDIKCELFSCRVKEFTKFFEKIRRNKYDDPFTQNEDFCGFRIVSFYLKDLEKINEIIRNHFNVITTQDKEEEVDVHHFGYRAKHYIVTLKDEWLKYPKLKNFKGIKFEIQVRTLNMHSWSQASHGLDYKNEHLVPKQVRRKLFRASAFLEQADVIFEELRREIQELAMREDILTVHSLKRYLERKFPDKKTEDFKIVWLFEEMQAAKMMISDINHAYTILSSNLIAIEQELAGRWGATGAARAILDITNDDFFKDKEKSRSKRWYQGVLNWREKLKSK